MKSGVKIICPHCHHQMIDYFCKNCHIQFVISDNVAVFESDEDEFYEGKFVENKDAKGMLPAFLPESLKVMVWKFFVKYSLILRYQKFFVKHLSRLKRENRELKILDLACGGGNSFLEEFGEVYGVDFSHQSIEVAKEYYDHCFVADIYNLPFADASFDVVTSFELVEHIPSDRLDSFFQEIKRVMKPDAISMHYFVVDSQCSLGKFIKKYPEYYNEYFIEKDGHYGLRGATETLSLMKQEFDVVEYKSIFAKMLMPLGMVKYFDNEYAEKKALIKAVVVFSKAIVGNVYLHSLFSILLYPMYSIVDYFKKDDEGFNLLVCLKKRNEEVG